MDLMEMILKNRSYRRFFECETISLECLTDWVSRTRFLPSAANLQPLRFVIVQDRRLCAEIFPHLRWAAYLMDWDGPGEEERPSAYIVMLVEKNSGPFASIDAGIALQTILLSATEKGFGGCALASFDQEAIRRRLDISPQFNIILVIALGKPKEKIVLEEIRDGNVKYWRDEAHTHHVPKRKLEDVLLKVFS